MLAQVFVLQQVLLSHVSENFLPTKGSTSKGGVVKLLSGQVPGIGSQSTQNIILLGSFENEALENEDRSTKHPKLENEAPKSRKRSTLDRKRSTLNLENEAPKTRKRSTQNSKTKHPKTRHRSVLYKHETNVNTAEIKRDNEYWITNRMQLKSTQVVNAFPPLRGRPGGRLCFGRDQKTENAQTISRILLYCRITVLQVSPYKMMSVFYSIPR